MLSWLWVAARLKVSYVHLHSMNDVFAVKIFIIILFAIILSACGGSGSSNSGLPTPSPTPTGCSVAVATGPFALGWPTQSWENRSPASQGMCPDGISDAMTYAFNSGNDTGAVLVIRNGYIVAEEYSSDRMWSDLVTSWSVAKSFTSALMGRAIDDGYIQNLEQSVSDFIPSWQSSQKAEITLDHLMTLSTALELINGGVLYNSEDQLQISIDRALIGTPGEKLYNYSNTDVMLAGEVIKVATGLKASTYLDNVLNTDLQASTFEWWTDSKGHDLTYCCLDGVPRDFARFGLLYSRGGQWDGKTIVSEEWVTSSTAPALSNTYAYYWWPAVDGFVAIGLHNQIIAIFPADDLIILRFSKYTRLGDGSTIRIGNNEHSTVEPQNFDNATFLNLVYSAFED